MRILLIVGYADSVFAYNYAKWLKQKENSWIVDVVQIYDSNPGVNSKYYNELFTVDRKLNVGFLSHVKLFDTYYQHRKIKKILEDGKYDIIHCHWLIPEIISLTFLKKYCSKAVATLWGGELVKQEILGSKKLYLFALRRFLKSIDAVLNSKASIEKNKELWPPKIKCISASFGSEPMEQLHHVMSNYSKRESKEKLGFPSEKLSVMIGYSAKDLHQHIPIILELCHRDYLREKIHLVLPMTRDANMDYVEKVNQELVKSGFSYTLIANRFMTDLEVAELRNATDIVLQLSTFDGFSRSILECLFAKAILIYGDWLGYTLHLEGCGCTGIPTGSIKGGCDALEKIIISFNEYKSVGEQNNIKLQSQGLWSKCIEDWIIAYKNLLS